MPNVEAVVVDTHVLLWWQAGGDRLSIEARRRIERADVLYVSPITCWEIAMLVSKRRVALDRPVSTWINDLLATSTAAIADLTPTVAVAAGELPDFHGDPADRIIYATAATRQLPLITKDRRLHDLSGADGGAVMTLW
ncbi:MAG: type II toxin-antitoxin system VapC family toxin [Acidimicrobiales bacterium]